MKLFSLAFAMGVLGTLSSEAQHISGCANQEATPISKQVRVAKSTGNPQLDHWLDREGQILRGFYGVNPSLVIYEDSLVEKPNACASMVPESSNYPDGTVAIGYNYLQNMYNYSGNFSMIPIVAAHEFAHVIDFTLKVTPTIPIYKEIYADFMAGCFIAYSSNQNWVDISRSYKWIIRIGDNVAISDPQCYGTPMQRMDAFKSGYEWLKSQTLAGNKPLARDASDAAKHYLNLSDNNITANK